jgi:AcrR family transcriptional regulator
MRAVARAAGTNTPAVYRRFRTRKQILCALVRSYQRELLKQLEPCGSLSQIAQCVLDFALHSPREYQLITAGWLASVKERPNFDFVAYRCAEWMGGRARDHEGLVFALWSLAHGTAMLRLSGTLREEELPRARAAFTQAVEVLIANADRLQRR